MEFVQTSQELSLHTGIPVAVIIGLFIALSIWGLYWKGRALWASAQDGTKWWFIFFLLVSTFGLLEIVYLYFLRKKKE